MRSILTQDLCNEFQIYSKTSVEMKRKALEKLTVHPVPDKEEQKADWTKDQDLMIWLKSLQ